MSIDVSGSRGLVRISMNYLCQFQAAMVSEQVSEQQFYAELTGTKYTGEFGERQSARRRGLRFETYLHQNDAAELRRAVAPTFGLNPDAMTVRNFEIEVPGPRDHFRAQRLYRTRGILADFAAGRPVPDLIIQPQLLLPTGSGPTDRIHVSPDFLVLDHQLGMYVPGEEKSFIVLRAGADPGDLNISRRQAATQLLALRAEAGRVNLAARVGNSAVFVFASPYGLKPAEPVVEQLDAEISEIDRAMVALAAVRLQLSAVRGNGSQPLARIATSFVTNYQDSCAGACILADHCARKAAGQARFLGDGAASVLGSSADLDRVVDLLHGAAPASPREAAVARLLREGLAVLGQRPNLRRVV